MREILYGYLKEQKMVIIYGTGSNGKFLRWLFNRNNVKVDYFCDSNAALWEKDINGIRCISPQELVSYTEAVILISPVKNLEIKERLSGFHFKKVMDWESIKFLSDRLSEDKPDQAKEYADVLLSNDMKLKEFLGCNKRFKDIHKGRRCFIIGNGPSLQKEDLSSLAGEITFTANQIARNPQFKDINTNYHLWADSRFFRTDLKCEGDYALLDIMKQLPEETECFFQYDSMREYVKKFELDRYINVNYYAVHPWIGEQTEIDFSGYIRGAWSVVQYAIRLAIYMGIKEIYLLGCDCTTIMHTINAKLSSYTLASHCYDTDENERERERLMHMERPMRVYYQAEVGILDGYQGLKQYCMQRDIAIYDCTQGGLLEEFPKKYLRDVVGKEN